MQSISLTNLCQSFQGLPIKLLPIWSIFPLDDEMATLAKWFKGNEHSKN